jgi:hypothetical protein
MDFEAGRPFVTETVARLSARTVYRPRECSALKRSGLDVSGCSFK